ncbi:hypothetical protein [Bacillus pumilus]|uniref:response regulator aspartate phosphatase n=1 Tax=Bacillus pumilus TaxID=1408 RepID=UPI0033068D67
MIAVSSKKGKDNNKKKIKPSYVAQLLVQWNDAISKSDKKLSRKIEKEVERSLDLMEQDFEVVEYYQLTKKHALHKLRGLSDYRWLKFYKNFSMGLYEFDQKKYADAIHYYGLAEPELIANKKNRKDIKYAVFNYRLAQAYYQIDQYFASMNKAKEARDIFDLNRDSKYEALECTILLGANNYDMKNLDQAKRFYLSALTEAKKYGYDKLISKIYHNLGLIHWLKKSYESYVKAIEYFIKALDDESFADQYAVQTIHMITWLMYIIKDERAVQWFERGIKIATEENDEEFISKLNILYSTYEEVSIEKILENLEYLEKRNMWPDVAEITLQLSELWAENKDFEVAYSFLSKHVHANEQTKRILEALE